MQFKNCAKCELQLSLEEFGKLSSSKDGYNYYCKNCERNRSKLFREKKEEELGMTYSTYIYAEKKDYFKNYKANLTETQKINRRNSNKIYYSINNIKIKTKAKKRRSTREYKNIANEKSRERRQNDIEFKLRRDVSNYISKALKKSNSSKNKSSIMNYLNYDIKTLKTHIELLFEPWMNWENYGVYKVGEKKWHIDHIIPQSKLPYNSMEHENFKKCWELSNLRPLEAFANISKGNKV